MDNTTFLKYVEHKCVDIEKCLDYACQINDINLIELLWSDNYNVDVGIAYACKYNNLDLVKLFILKGIPIVSECMRHACINGNLDIVKLLVINGSANLHQGIVFACSNGYVEIVKYLIEHGVDPLREYSNNASFNGHLEIVKYLGEHYDIYPDNDCVAFTCKNGHLDIIKYLAKTEKYTDFNAPFKSSVYYGRYDIAAWLVDQDLISNSDEIPYDATLELLNRGCETFENKFTYSEKQKRRKKQNKIREVIKQMKIYHYDNQITEIINEYIPYE